MHLSTLRPVSVLLAGLAATVALSAADLPAGLVFQATSQGATDRGVAENVWLYVPPGTPATPFLPAGAFEASWTGYVSCELRSQYTLHAECQGDVKVIVNGAVALESAGKGDAPVDGAAVKFNKGTNQLSVFYKAPPEGAAFLRLYWSNKETPYNPLPSGQLSHDDSPELAKALTLHRGRDLFTEFRCAKCHTGPTGMSELAMDAPAFAGIGGRRRFSWMAKWIENPAALRTTAHMPRLFTGPDAAEKASAAAAYLASLGAAAPAAAPAGSADDGKALYDKLHCAACHNVPDGSPADPAKLDHKSGRAKFAPGALVAFLQNPAEHYAWIRMPNFKLTPTEAANLAAFLIAGADPEDDRSAPSDPAVLEKGKSLVQSSGCLNCHALDQANNAKAPALASIPAADAGLGCLAETPAAGGKAPVYGFSPADRAALRGFLAADRASLDRQTDADFLERQSAHLNCRECHGKFDGFPTWELLAGKLKPDWAERFISGKETWKPRTWLEARMPAFPAYAHGLAVGLAEHAGFGPTPASDPAPADTAELAKVGQKLAGPNGGFSCVSCHSIADFAATQVFEAPGLNLAHAYERLQKSYFQRWLRAPTSLDPASKMPVYFDEEGRSPLSEVLGGDGPKTIGAVWEYLRLADKMPKPE